MIWATNQSVKEYFFLILFLDQNRLETKNKKKTFLVFNIYNLEKSQTTKSYLRYFLVSCVIKVY